MIGWNHLFNRHELGQTPGDGDRWRSLSCCHPELQIAGHDLVTEQQQIIRGCQSRW